MMNARAAAQLQIDDRLGTELVREVVAPRLSVTSVRPLVGGSVNKVVELRTDGEPASVVAKLADAAQSDNLRQEYASLAYFAEHTSLPVPRTYALIDRPPGIDGSVLLMQHVPGVTLADARLTDRGRHHLQIELAEHVIDLHRHTRDTFGSATSDAGHDDWVSGFGPRLHRESEAVRDMISTTAREVIDRLVDAVDRMLPRNPTPTLIHGDLWANNILVDDSHPDRPHVTAVIDGRAEFADAEYELAYLKLFQTVNGPFFETYEAHHPPRPGHELRFRVYWIESMMRHLRLFGDRYRGPVEEMAERLRPYL